jgi:hypothetical protein
VILYILSVLPPSSFPFHRNAAPSISHGLWSWSWSFACSHFWSVRRSGWFHIIRVSIVWEVSYPTHYIMYPGMHGHIHMHKTKNAWSPVVVCGMGFRLASPCLLVSGRSRDEVHHLGGLLLFSLLRLLDAWSHTIESSLLSRPTSDERRATSDGRRVRLNTDHHSLTHPQQAQRSSRSHSLAPTRRNKHFHHFHQHHTIPSHPIPKRRGDGATRLDHPPLTSFRSTIDLHYLAGVPPRLLISFRLVLLAPKHTSQSDSQQKVRRHHPQHCFGQPKVITDLHCPQNA